MKARRVWGLLLFLLGALVSTPALLCLFWPTQAAALQGVLERLGEGFMRDVLVRGYRATQDYPRTVAVAAGTATLLGLGLLLWPARKALAMLVGADWAMPENSRKLSFEAEDADPPHERPEKQPFRFPYPETENTAKTEHTREGLSRACPTEAQVAQPAVPATSADPMDAATASRAAQPPAQAGEPAPEITAKPAVPSVACPACGALNSERAYFCRRCGADMPPSEPSARQESQPASAISAEPPRLHYIWENQPLPQTQAPYIDPSPAPKPEFAPSPLMEPQAIPAPATATAAPSPLDGAQESMRQSPAPAQETALSPAPPLGVEEPVRIVSTVGRAVQKSSSSHLRPASFD